MTKMWLSDRNYEYVEYNISENLEFSNDLARMGFRVTPVVVVGDQMIAGFSPQKLEQALA